MPASLWISFWYFLLGSSRLTRGFVARKSFFFIGNLQTNEAQFCGALLFRTSNSPITIFVLHHLTEFWANSRFLEQWFYLQFSFGMCAKISVNLLFKPNPSFPELQYENMSLLCLFTLFCRSNKIWKNCLSIFKAANYFDSFISFFNCNSTLMALTIGCMIILC